MTEYVVAYAFTVESGSRRIPMILKNKPAHLKGVLNFPGGKVEKGEDPITAAVRELKEETGLDEIGVYDGMVPMAPELVGTVYGWDSIIHVVTVPVCGRQELAQLPTETEKVGWFDLTKLQCHPKLMPNLRVVIQLIQAGCKGWEVVDRKHDFRQEMHTVELYLNTAKNVGWEALQVTVPGMAYYKEEDEQ